MERTSSKYNHTICYSMTDVQIHSTHATWTHTPHAPFSVWFPAYRDFSGLLQSFCTDDDKLLKLQFGWEAWSLNVYTLYCIDSTVFLFTPLLNNLFLSVTSQRGRLCNTLKFWVTTFRSKSNSTGQLLGEKLVSKQSLSNSDWLQSLNDRLVKVCK